MANSNSGGEYNCCNEEDGACFLPDSSGVCIPCYLEGIISGSGSWPKTNFKYVKLPNEPDKHYQFLWENADIAKHVYTQIMPSISTSSERSYNDELTVWTLFDQSYIILKTSSGSSIPRGLAILSSQGIHTSYPSGCNFTSYQNIGIAAIEGNAVVFSTYRGDNGLFELSIKTQVDVEPIDSDDLTLGYDYKWGNFEELDMGSILSHFSNYETKNFKVYLVQPTDGD